MVEEESTMKRLLDLFQDSKRKGANARLFLETRNGEMFVNFSSQLPRTFPSGAGYEEVKKKKWKSPSSRRRDTARLEAWKVRRNISETVENLSAELNNEKEGNDDETSDIRIMDENRVELLEVNNDSGVEKSSQIESNSEDDDEECQLPKTVNMLKVFVDGLRDLEGVETEIEQILFSKNVVIKRMKVLKEFEISGIFKKIFLIEIEVLKRSDLLILQDEFRLKRNTNKIFKMESSFCSGYMDMNG